MALAIGISNRGTVDNGAHVPEQLLQTFRGVIGVDAFTGQLAWRIETSAEPYGLGVTLPGAVAEIDCGPRVSL